MSSKDNMPLCPFASCIVLSFSMDLTAARVLFLLSAMQYLAIFLIRRKTARRL